MRTDPSNPHDVTFTYGYEGGNGGGFRSFPGDSAEIIVPDRNANPSFYSPGSDSSDAAVSEAEAKSALGGALAGLSRDDLTELKVALNNSSLATGLVAIPIGALMAFISPGALALTVVGGGLAATALGFSYLSSEVDRYLATTD